MKRETLSLCFNCHQEVGDPPRLNRLSNGLPCPACRDRILAFLPAPLPGPGSLSFQQAEVVAEDEVVPKAGNLFAVDFSDHDEPA